MCAVCCIIFNEDHRKDGRKVRKSGGAGSNGVGIICPPPSSLVEIGLTDQSNSGTPGTYRSGHRESVKKDIF